MTSPRTEMKVSISEAKILSVAAQIGFGELLDVEVPSSEEIVTWDVTPSQERFIQLLRAVNSVDRIIVHNSEPVSMEVSGGSDGIKYIRKFKV